MEYNIFTLKINWKNLHFSFDKRNVLISVYDDNIFAYKRPWFHGIYEYCLIMSWDEKNHKLLKKSTRDLMQKKLEIFYK